MRIIKKTYNVSQQNLIDSLAKNAGILRSTAEILYGRGYDTAEKALEFMSPEKWERYSPFTLSGMSEAVERIKEAKENGETVVVYGDYDVDGICATTV
jgi:single-stranded-DNA-specific exonuclease